MIKIKRISAYLVTICTIIGLGISLYQLPNPSYQVPGWLLITAAVIALLSIIASKWAGVSALLIVATWALVNYSSPYINSMTANLSTNQFINFDPTLTAYLLGALITTIPALSIGLLWAVKQNQEEVNPSISEESMENPITTLIERYKFWKFTKKYKWLDLEICRDARSNKPVILKGHDRFLPTIISGSTGTGKTSRTLKPWLVQDLIRIKNGHKMAITVIEPSGDLAQDIADLCDELDIPYVHVDPFKANTAKFNPLQGDAESVAETTRTVLTELFGRQEAFFSQVQQTAARNVILLLKKLQGDDLDLTDVVRVLRDQQRLANMVASLKNIEGNTDLVQYFDKEMLGAVMQEKYQQFAAGLRMQLEDIVGNSKITNVITGNSSIDLDKHMAEGGVFLVNTGLELGKVGDAFGKFVIGQVKAALFRRPGNEWTRIPHHLIIDEFPVYVNEDFRRVLAIGRKYRNIATLAVQTVDDIEYIGGKTLARIFLQNCRNKIVFGGMDGEDAKRWERAFGYKEVEVKNPTYENRLVVPPLLAKNYKMSTKEVPRVPYTKLMELKEFQFIYQIVRDARLQPPGQGKTDLVDINKVKKKINNTTTVKLPSIKEKVTSGIKGLKKETPSEPKTLSVDIPNSKPETKPDQPQNSKEEAKDKPLKKNKVVFVSTKETKIKPVEKTKEEPKIKVLKTEKPQPKQQSNKTPDKVITVKHEPINTNNSKKGDLEYKEKTAAPAAETPQQQEKQQEKPKPANFKKSRKELEKELKTKSFWG